jgi:hypothetical protein
MLEMKIVIRAILEAQRIEPVAATPEPPRRRNITITPAAGSRVRLSAPEREPVASA